MVQRDRQLIINKQWRFEPILDFQPTRRLTNYRVRLQNRIAKERYRRFQTFSADLLGYGAKAMLKVARRASADLTIVHSEAGLWVGNQLLDEGFRVGVDFEDWFSEDLLPHDRATRPIAQLKALEHRLIRECQYCLTTSQAMAEVMATAYQAPNPTVIYNTFSWAEREYIDYQKRDRKNPQLPSIHWFSQTIGPGRGLELLFQALPYLSISAEIHLRGHYSNSSRQWLEPLLPANWRDRIFIHRTVPNTQLLSRIAEHDVGLALETPYCLNKQFTTSNKLFQYLQAGLAVIATDTAGQREVFSQFPAIGQLISHQDPIALAHALQEVLSSHEKLAACKCAALSAIEQSLCWENQVDKLVNKVNQVCCTSYA